MRVIAGMIERVSSSTTSIVQLPTDSSIGRTNLPGEYCATSRVCDFLENELTIDISHPSVFKLYMSTTERSANSKSEKYKKAMRLCRTFKVAFSQPDVKVHFVGVW